MVLCLVGGLVGRPRGGQRYGRPKHAGGTRKRVNVALAERYEAGNRVVIWVRPHQGIARAELRRVEEETIRRWDLRSCALNRQ